MFRQAGFLILRISAGAVTKSTKPLQPAMKTTPFAIISSTALAFITMASPQALAQSANPLGTLTASPSLVPPGTRPTLAWSISYPVSASVKDFVTITTPGGITPKQNLLCDIRIIGAGVTTKDSKGKIVYVETLGRLLCNGGSWATIFDGTNTSAIVQQQGLVIPTFTATANQPMNFGGYYIFNGVKSTTYTSLVGDNVRFQVNGDTPPSYVPDYNAPSLQSFIKPYLDASGKVKIGPMDVIVFMELTTSNKATLGYDLQDLVFLITFHNP